MGWWGGGMGEGKIYRVSPTFGTLYNILIYTDYTRSITNNIKINY
jgi:hypothetical protein